MSLPNYLSNIKSSGIYRFVWDKSEISGVQAETLRLVVGYAEKGIFNTPVYVRSASEFKTIFGSKSKKLERYGVYFHRMALQALKKGPILALNLKPFDKEAVDCVSFNPQEEISTAIKLKVNELYNTNKFWTLEPEQLEEVSEKYISITATDSKEVSNTIFVRGFQPSGYDISISEWYSSVLNGEEVPDYLEGHERDLLSQYWVEVYVFRGQFTPSIAASDKLSKFFIINGDHVELKPYIENAFGEKIDTLQALANNSSSNFIKSYSGILLPEFLSSSNTVISIDTLFNADQYQHKMMMRLNQSALYNGDITVDQLDTTGWTKAFDAVQKPFLSLSVLEPQISRAVYRDYTWNYGSTTLGTSPDFYDYDTTTIVDGYSMKVEPKMSDTGVSIGNKFVFRGDEGMYVANLVSITEEYNDGNTSIDDAGVQEFIDTKAGVNGVGSPYTFRTKVEWNDGVVVLSGTEQQLTGSIAGNEDTRVPGWLSDAARMLRVIYETNPTGHRSIVYNGISYVWDLNGTLKGSNYKDASGATLMSVIVRDLTTKFPNGLQGVTPQELERIIKLTYANGDVYEFTVVVTAETTTTGVDASAVMEDLKKDIISVLTHYIYTFDKPVGTAPDGYHLVRCMNSATYTSNHLTPTYVEGYTYESSKPASTKQIDKLKWQNRILDVMTLNKGIRSALTSRVDVDYRYIIDTFEGFVDSECKSRISIIAKEKDNAFALCNFPSMNNFSRCDYTSFNDDNGVFDTRYIPQGGNSRRAITKMFSLPSEENGASHCGFFTSLNMRDTDTGIKYVCPSAALVSNDFMDKYTKYFPYTVVAGTNRGVISENGLIGPDFNFGRSDLDNLEPMGVNCMVYTPGVGTYINSNQTAKQNPVTALSKINIRELCIFLQDEIEKLLEQYHWDFNTPNLRSTIKDRADVILSTAQSNGGVSTFLNICDESNNTEDVINNEMFVLSTSIEPGFASGKMVQELTLYRHGGMSSLVKTY